MATKDETTKYIKDFCEFTKTQFNKLPKTIRSDRGREYVNNDLRNYLLRQGISIQYTAGYSPQQNGVAERKNRSLIEMAKCMLLEAQMDKKYWGEAVQTANYLQNILPTKATGKTPYQLWFSTIPDVKDLHIFGTEAYVHIPKENRRKLDEKAKKLRFVGYSNESKAYRLLNTDTDKVVISRDVIFLEDSENSKAEEVVFQQGTQLDKKVEDNNLEEGTNNFKEGINDNSIQDQVAGSENADESTDEDEPKRNEKENQKEKEIRRSARSNKGVPPNWYMGKLNLITDIGEPKTRAEALSRDDKEL